MKALHAALRPVDIAPLVLFRVAFGLLVAWEMASLLWSGFVGRNLIDPPFHFTYRFFDWVRPLPGWGSIAHVAGLSVVAVSIGLGLFYRWATLVFTLGFAWLFLIDETYYLNHFYLIGLLGFLLTLSPAARELSVDVARGRVSPARTMPVCLLWVLRLQFGVVYFFGGVSKLNPEWLRGEPMRHWLAERAGGLIPQSLVGETWFVLSFAWGGLAIDLLAVPLLLWRRTRPAMFAVTLLFHVMNAGLWTIGVFPWLMIAGTALFFPPERLRALLDGLHRLGGRPKPVDGVEIAEQDVTGPTRGGRVLVGVLTVYVAVQCLLPWRQFLYPGSFVWTGEGTRFGWHMLHRRTTGAILFSVRDPVSGRAWIVDPREYVTPRQAEQLAANPEMILQFAHALADEATETNGTRPEVRALGLVSLNGRPRQPLVDPEVDLAAEPRDFGRRIWIVPLRPLPKGA